MHGTYCTLMLQLSHLPSLETVQLVGLTLETNIVYNTGNLYIMWIIIHTFSYQK